jgi:putative ABC transport system substrate-binding protein
MALPLAPRAQQGRVPLIGFLAPQEEAKRVAAFRQGLGEAGIVQGRNAEIDLRTGGYAQMPGLAAELLRERVSVILTSGTLAAQAAKAATTAVPIVFVMGSDPVKIGLAHSLNRPGGNVTGITTISHALLPKHFELLREIVPAEETIHVLVNPQNPDARNQMKEISVGAAALGQRIVLIEAASNAELEAVFASLGRQRVRALLVGSDGFFNSRPGQIAALAARHAIPAISHLRTFTEAGGLMSYGASTLHAYRQAGVYVGRVLKGERPADMPIQQPTKFELVINLKTAKLLGLTVSELFLQRADEVIE